MQVPTWLGGRKRCAAQAAEVADRPLPEAPAQAPSTAVASTTATTKARGDAAEAAALAHLQANGLTLVARNYRTPGRGGGEIDLIMREPATGTLVFAEVRQRGSASHGGAAGSVTPTKQRRIVLAARHYLMQTASPPPCRFDVVLVEPTGIEWIRGAFDAS